MIEKLTSTKKTGSRGMTLVETVIAVSLFAVVMVTLFSAIIYFYRSNAYSLQQMYAIMNGRRGVEFLVRNIREMTYSEEGAYPMISMGSTTFSFYSDIDLDNQVEKVRYFLDGTDFKRGVTKPDGTPPYSGVETISLIASHVRNEEQGDAIFTYFDKDGVEVTDYNAIGNVVYTRVSLIVNINPDRRPNEFVIRSSGTLRNIIKDTIYE